MLIIGITTFDETKEGIRGEYSIVHKKYADSIIAAGGIPVLIPMNKDTKGIKELVAKLDGIILSGGDEFIQPKLYNRQASSIVTHINPIRDQVELEILKECQEQKKGVFGICRGMQLINVYFGGDLYLNINAEVEGSTCHVAYNTKKEFIYHDVTLIENKFLHNLLKIKTLGVNTYHSQAIRNIASNLTVAAISEDGIIEAVEHDLLPIFGVQWHPEAMTENYEEQLNIFRYFLKECKKNGK